MSTGLKHLSLHFKECFEEEYLFEPGATIPFATTLASLSLSFHGDYEKAHANFFHLLLPTIHHLKEFHMVTISDYVDQQNLVVLLTSPPLSGLERLSLRHMELSTSSVTQILSSYSSLRQFTSTLREVSILGILPSSLECWTFCLPTVHEWRGERLEKVIFWLDALCGKDWPGRADWSLKVIRIEGHFTLLNECAWYIDVESTGRETFGWSHTTNSYRNQVAKLDAKCKLNGIRLEPDQVLID